MRRRCSNGCASFSAAPDRHCRKETQVSLYTHAATSVATLSRRGKQLGGALVTQEVVAREDVVDLETFGARETLAHVALEQRRVPHQLASFLVRELAGLGWAPARLAT